MAIYAFTDFHDGVAADDAAARHLRIWLAASGSSYGAAARELFVQTHPALFGRASELTLRGYDRWRWRRRLHDTPATFARYMAPRHQRWLAAQGDTSLTAPCLIGSGNLLPCWAGGGSEPCSVHHEFESAA